MSTQAETDEAEAKDVENEEIEHFLHGQDIKPKVAIGAAGETLREVLIRYEIIREDHSGIFVFVGECDEALREPVDMEDGFDQHEPVEIDLTLEALEIRRHRHVHCHRCRHATVDVNYGGKTRRHRFSPATTVEVATKWARHKFRLDPSAASEYVLQIHGTTTQPRGTEHLGELVAAPGCSICFDLVTEVTPQG